MYVCAGALGSVEDAMLGFQSTPEVHTEVLENLHVLRLQVARDFSGPQFLI